MDNTSPGACIRCDCDWSLHTKVNGKYVCPKPEQTQTHDPEPNEVPVITEPKQ